MTSELKDASRPGASTAVSEGSGRRAGWTVADQALSSITNFGLSVLVARSVDAAAFGAFSLAFTTYLILVGVSRSMTTDPLVVRFSASSRPIHRDASRQATGAALTLGLIGGLLCALVGGLFGGRAGDALLAFSVVLPGLLLQDAWRFVFFSGSTPRQAFVNDLLWAVVQFTALAILLIAGQPSVFALVMAWGGAAGVSAVAGCVQTRTLPRLQATPRWFRNHRDLGPPFLGEFAALSGASNLTFYALGALAGLAELGAVRGGYVLFGPLNVVLLGARLVAVPEGVRIRAVSLDALRRNARLLAGTLAVCAAGIGGVIMFLPASVGEWLLGDTWANVAELRAPLALMNVAIAVAAGPSFGLRALGAAKATFMTRVTICPFILAGGIGGAAIGEALGAVTGLAIAYWISVLFWWREFTREANRHASLSQEQGA